MNQKFNSLLKIVLPIIFLTIFGIFLQLAIVSHPEKVTTWLSSFGPFLILVYVLVQTVGIVIPPFPGGVVQIALIAILGPEKAIPLIYIVVTPLYCVNFLIAKKYGRPFVEKLLGKHEMVKIDHYVANAGLGTLIMLKIFLGNFFDFISYGIGLTSINFRQFFWVNLLAGIPQALLEYYIFSHSPNFLSGLILLGISGAIFTGAYATFHRLKN